MTLCQDSRRWERKQAQRALGAKGTAKPEPKAVAPPVPAVPAEVGGRQRWDPANEEPAARTARIAANRAKRDAGLAEQAKLDAQARRKKQVAARIAETKREEALHRSKDFVHR
jgi:hypothetical protein